eukprot:2613944-Amphidinium_carterae.1
MCCPHSWAVSQGVAMASAARKHRGGALRDMQTTMPLRNCVLFSTSCASFAHGSPSALGCPRTGWM